MTMTTNPPAESLGVLLGDHRLFHSTLQCRRFITAKAGVTPYGMYRQALRELNSRTWSLFDEMLRREEIQVDLDELARKVEVAEETYGENNIQLRRLRLEQGRKVVEMAQLEHAMTDRYREWAEFYGQCCTLRPLLGLREGQQLAEDKRDLLDEQMFAHQFAAQIRARIEAGERPLDSALTQVIETLPTGIRTPLLAAGQNQQEFIQWHDSQRPGELPAPEALPTPEEVERLIRERFGALAIERPKLGGLLE